MNDKVILAVGLVVVCVYVIIAAIHPAHMSRTYKHVRDAVLRSAITGLLLGGLTNCTRVVVCNFIALIAINVILEATYET